MKVLVFGSRKWVDQKTIEKVLNRLPPRTIIIEGAAPGVDNIAGYVARKMKYIVREYPALDKGRTWPSAGPLRNQDMLDCEHPDVNGKYIDRAICFHEDPNLGKGSKDMKDRLEKALPEIPVEVILKHL